MMDLYDLGDHRQTQRTVTLQRCHDRIATLGRQREDIDATIAELNDFIDLLEGRPSTFKTKD
ncbi:MAG: transcriptional regulator, partial [Sphingomicrobium sp.]